MLHLQQVLNEKQNSHLFHKLNIITLSLHLRLYIVMRHDKQKKDDSQDEFEEMREEVETIAARGMDSPPKNIIKNNPRLHYLAEKHKLGFVANLHSAQTPPQPHHKKQAPISIGKIIKIGSATFRSNFQSGSLGNVELIGSNSFRISLDTQTNSSRCNNWFDFIVEGVKGQASFTIVGFRKRTSLYNEGMKICYQQVGQNSKWKRGGTHISYTKETNSEEEGRRYEVKFSYFFKPMDHNSVEFAYCFPYGPSKLHELLALMHAKTKVQTITSSFEGIDLPLINLGNLSSKEVIVLSARVHPGETVSSFIMEGFLKEIVSDCEPARYLRDKFLFKIMPMINIDGVRHGNFRFSASGVDLNRRWKNPSEEHHPEIYYLKQMILRENKQKRVRMFIDMHGHSRKKNVFFYGCCRENQNIQDNFHPKAFPFLMSKIHQAYSYPDCSFTIQPDKEGTARISLWNQLKINQIYTLEASFCSSTKGLNYQEADYEKIGHKLCQGIALYFYESSPKYSHLTNALSFREKVFNELKSDASLLKQGNQQNSGSESQPEKGERSDQYKEREKLIHNIGNRHDTNEGNSSANSKQEPLVQAVRHHSNKQTHNTIQQLQNLQIHLADQLAFKHKSEAAMHDDNAQISPQHLKQIFPSYHKLDAIKTDTIELEKTPYEKHSQDATKHIRVHHPIKGNSVPVTKIALYSEEDPLNEEQQRKKDKRIVSAFESTQYRRIKHMMEQKFAEKLSQHIQPESPSTLVQSINARKIEVEPPRHAGGVVPKFYANTPMKKRKSSVEIFYNKPSKSVGRSQKDTHNVMCRGRQIML